MSVGWKQRLVRSLHINRSHADARYFQIATVDHAGRPDNRTVVFRGFRESDPLTLLTVTDTRSDKVAQLRANPAVSVAWYFRKSREQYRLNGQGRLLEVDAAAPNAVSEVGQVWQKLSAAARAQFFWPTPKAPVGEAAALADEGGMSPHFAVLMIEPFEVQYLTLKGTPQRRELYRRTDKGWTSQAVNP